MPYAIKVLEFGKVSIIQSEFTGHLSPQDFSDWNRALDTMEGYDISQMEHIYSIMVVPPGTTADFSTIVQEMTTVPDEMDNLGITPRNFTMMFVSDSPMVKLAVQLAKRSEFFGGQDVPMFRTLEDALAFIALDRQKMESDAQQPVARQA